MQCVWADPAYRPAALRTSRGEDVRVQDPGRWNLEAGPDFLDAVLLVGAGGRRVTGDVEVHVRPADWAQHKHEQDPRYARVVAHVSYFPSRLPPPGLGPGVLSIALRDALLAAPAFSFDAIDVAAYPYAAVRADRAPCGRAVRDRPPEERWAWIEAAGEERLRRKACRLAAACAQQGAEETLYEEMLSALGYKQNRAACRGLARRLPRAALVEQSGGDPLAAYALLLGVAGLLPARTRADWDDATRALVRGLWDHWWKRAAAWDGLCLPPGTWTLSGLRPQNHPLRRLAAAAELATAGESLAEELLGADSGAPAKRLARAKRRLAQVGRTGYWATRLSLGGAPRPAPVALLGAERSAAILSNVLVPLLAARGAPVGELLGNLAPEQDNQLVREMAFRLFGRDHNPALHHTGLRQQGLLQVFHDFCLCARGGCGSCPLPQMLQAAT